jgi:TPR repeat protein
MIDERKDDAAKGTDEQYHNRLQEFREAAEQGDAQAQYKLGCHLLNNGDEDNAIIWFRESAEQGYADSQYELGCLLFKEKHGCGVLPITVVIIIAVSLFIEIPTPLTFGVLPIDGDFDFIAARAPLFLPLAIAGIILWFKGRKQEERNIEAMQWLQKAAKQGHANAKSKLEKIRG